jgi:hypothetical protein
VRVGEWAVAWYWGHWLEAERESGSATSLTASDCRLWRWCLESGIAGRVSALVAAESYAAVDSILSPVRHYSHLLPYAYVQIETYHLCLLLTLKLLM